MKDVIDRLFPYFSFSAGGYQQNKRVGEFQSVDANGVKWIEQYDATGKRTSRKKVRGQFMLCTS